MINLTLAQTINKDNWIVNLSRRALMITSAKRFILEKPVRCLHLLHRRPRILYARLRLQQSFVNNNVVFPAEAKYSHLSAYFKLKIFLWTSSDFTACTKTRNNETKPPKWPKRPQRNDRNETPETSETTETSKTVSKWIKIFLKKTLIFSTLLWQPDLVPRSCS